jgi:hypothetical protein
MPLSPSDQKHLETLEGKVQIIRDRTRSVALDYRTGMYLSRGRHRQVLFGEAYGRGTAWRAPSPRGRPRWRPPPGSLPPLCQTWALIPAGVRRMPIHWFGTEDA